MKMNDDDTSQSKLGRAGETLVINYFSKLGKKIEASVDQFDSEKDLLIDGEKYEVKTQVPFIVKDAFTFKPSQLKKCKNVKKVIFVSVPNLIKKHFSEGKVYQIDSDKLEYYKYSTKDGRLMILIPILQEYMEELFTLLPQESKLLQSYSISNWNKNG